MIAFQPQGVSVWEGVEAVHLQAGETKLEYSRNIVTNSRETPSWREIVSLTVLVKLASFTPPESNIYKNAKLRTQLFKKVSDQKDNTQDTSKNTKFAKQPIVKNPPKVGIDNTKTRRPQPRSNTKNDRVPSTSKNSQSQNKEAKVEEQHRNLLLSKHNKHISSA
nr:hypothetical protein [Tanacetum cinerariifolium]